MEKIPMSDGKRPKPQHAPKAPHENSEFLASTPARPIRIISEYIYPLVQLKKEGICDTIVMFGSARIHSHEAASSRYTRLKQMKTSRWSDARRKVHRPLHRAAPRTIRESLHQPRTQLQFPLFLHAQIVVRPNCQSPHRFS